jgi:nucleotide sugar dehydrogenase
MKKISIIGSGNVGRRIGEDFLKKGNNVIFYDVVESVVDRLNYSGREATLDISYAIQNSDISFVAVPTPVKRGGEYNYSYLKKAAGNMGSSLMEKYSYHIAVLKSTVTPGTTEDIFIPEMERASGKKEGDGFGVIYNPEFLTVIQNTWTDRKDFCISPGKEGRIVLGEGKSKKAGNIIETLLKEEVGKTPVLRTDYKTAEMTKLVANNRLSLVISFSNEIYEIAEELKESGVEIDADFVMRAVAMDPRIGPYGSVFGKAWGGPCFIKDTKAMEKWVKKKTGKAPKIISSSIKVNNKMKRKYGVRE